MTSIFAGLLTLLVLMQSASVSSFSAMALGRAPGQLQPASSAAIFGRQGLHVILCAAADDDAAAEEAPSTEVVAEEDEEEDDLLSSPAFLKQKLKVLEKELADVQEQTTAAKAEADEVSSEWDQKRTRLQTDFDNFKARHVNQTLEAQLDARVKVINEFLLVLDNFDRARASISPEGAEQDATNALYTEMHGALMTTLGELGMQKIEAVGSEFDYNLHMAIQQMPSDEYDEGIVCAELQPGYMCQDKLVRAAYVAVSA